MNVFRLILVTTAICLFTIPLQAQRPGEKAPGPMPTQRLQESLGLSDQQLKLVKPIFEETRNLIKVVRDQDFEHTEDRRAAIQTILEGQKEKLAELLTEEQLIKLEEMRPKTAFGGRGKGPGALPGHPGLHSDDDRLHQALQEYYKGNVAPVLRKQRAQLEPYLSEEDKQTIADIRERHNAHRKRRNLAKKRGKKVASPAEEQKAVYRSDRAMLETLIERYDSELEKLLEEVQPQAEQWREDRKAIHQQYQQGQGTPKGREAEGVGSESLKKKEASRQKVNFLLLDFSKRDTNLQMEAGALRIEAYPNPAKGIATFSYTLEQGGQIKIVLGNKAGNMNRILFAGYREAGAYSFEFNTDGLQAGTYFYTLSDASGQQSISKQLIITQ